MAKYATGKYAKAISDRSGMEFPYKEMVREWNGAFVHVSEFEPKQPQLEPKPMNGDAISLRNVRPSRPAPAVIRMIPENGFETYQAGSSIINVSFPGRYNSCNFCWCIYDCHKYWNNSECFWRARVFKNSRRSNCYWCSRVG